MFQVEPPPTPPASAAQVAASEDAHMLAASENVTLTVSRQNQAETAVVRYTFWTKAELTAERAPGGTADILCRWKLTAHQQRDYCLRSLTGRYACTESTMVSLPDNETGLVSLPSGGPARCGLDLAQVAEARQRFARTVADTRPQRVSADLMETLMPELRAGGFIVRRR